MHFKSTVETGSALSSAEIKCRFPMNYNIADGLQLLEKKDGLNFTIEYRLATGLNLLVCNKVNFLSEL